MSSPSRQRIAGLSLVLSVALHALAVWFLARAPTPLGIERAKPVEFEVVEHRPPPRPPPVVVAPPPPRPEPTPPPKSPARPQLAERPPLPTSSAPTPTATPDAPPPSALPPDVPRAAAPDLAKAATASAQAQLPSLVKDGDFAYAEPDAGPVRYIQPPDQIADPNERVAQMINSEQGKARVQRGLVDPYFAELSKALSKKWSVDPKDHQASLANYFSHFGENAKTGMNIWQSLADNYGSGGSPLGPTDEPHGAQTQAEAVHEFNRKLRDAWKQSKRTLVRITQGPGGLLQRVELVQSSADPGMDAEIIRELTQGELVLPMPPTSGMGIHSPLRSVWAFQLVISISPPVPALMGSFDEVTGTIDIRMPLDRRMFKMVELVSVD